MGKLIDVTFWCTNNLFLTNEVLLFLLTANRNVWCTEVKIFTHNALDSETANWNLKLLDLAEDF